LAAFETHAAAVASACQCTYTNAAAPVVQALAAYCSSAAAARVLPAAACRCGSISQTCCCSGFLCFLFWFLP